MSTYEDIDAVAQSSIDFAIAEMRLLIECIQHSIKEEIAHTKQSLVSHYEVAKIYNVNSILAERGKIKHKLALLEQQLLAQIQEFTKETFPLTRI